MATTFTNKLESFFDNNTPGGYIRTSINISDDDITERINRKFENQNYLTGSSMIPASQITGLAEVATSGRYNDLIGITGTSVNISNTLDEGIKIATITINGDNTDIYIPESTYNDDVLITETDPIFNASPAALITLENINAWNQKSNFSGYYSDLNDAPILPEDIGDDREAYYTINEGEIDEERKIKPLKLVAFTNDYNHLNNKPNNLYTFLNLQNFSNTILPAESSKIQTLGENNIFILNFKGFKNNNNYLLSEAIKNLVINYYNYSKEFVIINAIRRYKVLNINRILLDDNENNISLISMDYVMFNNNNYTNIRYNNSNNDFNGTIAEDQLSNLQITPQIGTLIFDYQNDVIYCKINNI